MKPPARSTAATRQKLVRQGCGPKQTTAEAVVEVIEF
jgi:hypothetical protein